VPFSLIALVLFPLTASAGDEVPAALRFFNNALFLAVIAVLGLAVWWLRRRLQPGASRGSGARVIPVAMLGTRERIAVVEFEGRRLLVGVTPQQITMLCELDRSSFAAAQSTVQPADSVI
jgi:flagellar protein FliO/FliZ